MVEPKRWKTIYGEEKMLKKLALLYSDCESELRSDEHHYEHIGYSRKGYVLDKRINDGSINHIVICISSKNWKLLTESLPIKKIDRRVWRLDV